MININVNSLMLISSPIPANAGHPAPRHSSIATIEKNQGNVNAQGCDSRNSLLHLFTSILPKPNSTYIFAMNNENAKFGFTAFAENWNGRLAMIGFTSALILELVSGQGVLHFFGIL